MTDEIQEPLVVPARFTGDNRTSEREWSTTSEVVADEPGEHVARSVGPGRVIWGFRLRAGIPATLAAIRDVLTAG